jgi:hypothetical protein
MKGGKRRRTLADRCELVSLELVRGITKILGKFGFSGIAVFLVVFISTDEQKKHLIDKWLLFKDSELSHLSTVGPLMIVAGVIFLVQAYYFRKEKRLLLREIDLKEKEIERLQTLFLNPKTEKKKSK